MHTDDAILSRRSVRAFLPTPVSRNTVEEILRIAARAPSGTNMQPWKVHVCTGAVKDAISAEVLNLHEAREAHQQEFKYYPDEFREPYRSRRRKTGWDLYSLLNIAKGEREKAHRQHGRNYIFFGAPVGLFFFIDRDLEIGSWLDYGMFLENVMIAARARGLHTCPQAAWPRFQRTVRRHLGVPDDEVLVCGMSLGYEDSDAVENRLRTVREPVENFARFSGFG